MTKTKEQWVQDGSVVARRWQLYQKNVITLTPDEIRLIQIFAADWLEAMRPEVEGRMDGPHE